MKRFTCCMNEHEEATMVEADSGEWVKHSDVRTYIGNMFYGRMWVIPKTHDEIMTSDPALSANRCNCGDETNKRVTTAGVCAWPWWICPAHGFKQMV